MSTTPALWPERRMDGTRRVPLRAKFAARRSLLRIVRAILRVRACRYPIEDNVRCLIVAPHQDDATLGCGGLILGKRLEGNPVDIVYITDGSASHRGHPTITAERLASQRRLEELASMETLGVERIRTHFLDAQDGTLASLGQPESDILVEKIADVLNRVAPDEIFLPCRKDGSSEHDAAFVLLRRALERGRIEPRLFEYPIWSLWAPQRLIFPTITSRRVWRAKFAGYEDVKDRALSVYKSQVEPTPPWTESVISPEFISFFRSNEEFFLEA